MNHTTDIPPEIDDHCEEGSEVEHDIKEELRLLHTEEGLEEDEVARTADRKEFGEPLNNSEKNSL